MKSSCYRVMASCAVGGLFFVTTLCAVAGGSEDHDEPDNSLRYYGFVKDGNGKPVAGARVSAEVKGLGTLIAVTDGTGAYRIPVPRVGPQISPGNIRISCAKDGYKQSRTVVRSNLNQKPLVAVEVECTLQGAAGK
jgi:hypothetical protein